MQLPSKKLCLFYEKILNMNKKKKIINIFQSLIKKDEALYCNLFSYQPTDLCNIYKIIKLNLKSITFFN